MSEENKENKEAKKKSAKQLPTAKQVNTPPISSCFGSKTSKEEALKSPEYSQSTAPTTMVGNTNTPKKRTTRNSSRNPNNGAEDQSDQGDQSVTNVDINNDEENQLLHSALRPCPEPIENNNNTFTSLSYADQMGNVVSVVNHLCLKVTEMDVAINHDTDGLNTRLETVTTQADSNTSALSDLQSKLIKADNKIEELKTENAVLKGVLCRHSDQLKTMNDRIAMLTAKSMEKNVTITGIKEVKDEDCKKVVVDFLKQKVEIDADEDEIFVAHRIGTSKRKNQPRIMLARCKPELKHRIFKNVGNLKEKVNENDVPYYINKQLPDQYNEKNRENRELIKQQRIKDKDLPPKEKAKIETRNKTVFIDNQPQEKLLLPIEVDELFPDQQEREKQDKIKLSSSDTVAENNSSFMAYAFKTGQIHEVRRAYRLIRRTHPSATHVVAAYNLKTNKGFQDDSEYGAGYRMLALLEQEHPPNYCIFIVRYYGGKHLGPKRFSIMTDTAQQALERARQEKRS